MVCSVMIEWGTRNVNVDSSRSCQSLCRKRKVATSWFTCPLAHKKHLSNANLPICTSASWLSCFVNIIYCNICCSPQLKLVCVLLLRVMGCCISKVLHNNKSFIMLVPYTPHLLSESCVLYKCITISGTLLYEKKGLCNFNSYTCLMMF